MLFIILNDIDLLDPKLRKVDRTPSCKDFAAILAGITFWLWKINNNLICLQTLIAIQENTVIHHPWSIFKNIYIELLFSLC